MTSQAETRSNPYPGPQAFQRGESLYGREREVNALLDLLIAERIVLLYSPSGAGKTSLIQAALIPELEKEGFQVLPVMRVGLEPPSDLELPPSANRYVLSLLLSIEETLSTERRMPQDELARLTVAEYLDRRPQQVEDSLVLVFDQFEEVLTVDSTNQVAKEAFFDQIGTVLRDRRRWALFAMREDHVAGLDPYLYPVPTRFSTTYRLSLLRRDAALEAVREPAARSGCPFAEGVAETLVDDLRRVQSGQGYRGVAHAPDAMSPQFGPTVEPVHLQIVCRRLWEGLPPDRTTILAEDVDQLGDVDQALTTFYETALRSVVEQTGIGERRLRAWFDTQLITPARTRGLVYRGTGDTGGLPNTAVGILNEAYIVRAHVRGNDTWYELVHDRLVEPVLQANDRWNRAYYNPLAMATQAWLDAGRPPAKLLDGSKLGEAQAFAKAHLSDLTEEERVYLAESTRQARQVARRRRTSIVVAVSVVIALSLLSLWALRNAAQARAQARLATSRELSAQAIAHLDQDPERSILLALHALQVAETEEGESALRKALIASRVIQRFYDQDNGYWDLELTPDGTRLAAAGQDGTITFWRADGVDVQEPERTWAGHEQDVLAIALDPGNGRLASAGRDGTAKVWNGETGELLFTLEAHTSWVMNVAYDPDGARLATAGYDGVVRLWDAASGAEITTLADAHDGASIHGLAFDPSGARLATGGEDHQVILWDLSGDPPRPQHTLSAHTDDVSAVVFDPEGARLASASRDKTAIVWDLAGQDAVPQQRFTLSGHTDNVVDVAFSPNGLCLATASLDRTAKLWDANTGRLLLTLHGHEAEVNGVSFIPNERVSGRIPTQLCGTQLVTASMDGTIRFWYIGASAEWRALVGHTDTVEAVLFSPDGTRLATASSDGSAKIWEVSTGEVLFDLPHQERVNRVAFSPDGTRLATASYDDTAKLWDMATGEELHTLRGHLDDVQGVEFSPDGATLATASSDGSIMLWSVALGQATRPPIALYRNAAIYDVAYSRDGAYLVAATEANNALVLSVDPVTDMGSLEHDGVVYDVAFSPDGGALATAGWDNAAKLWSGTPPWAEQHTLTNHVDRIFGLGFSEDGKRLATASADGSVTVWDVQSGQPLRTLPGAGEELNSAAFSPDGTQLAVSSDDGTVRFYLLDLKALQDVARSRLTRSWTERECQRFLHQERCPSEP